ncbi:hypothetical protein Glo7428_4440 [Gloeocapsa sp. PCC 7428]|uniref:hypothetical protein n=1 Tax=Gloeocapsa sp. PCC 7428 TaxID=1173026 RepID=UPI0002A5C519|nr:hypothetical protein [Gloeocapsa sp. PCC 7428]AFZ32883.1 hypothetical protein Glo7428_4440 [Gloeocapsa sp. PCC 7428]
MFTHNRWLKLLVTAFVFSPTITVSTPSVLAKSLQQETTSISQTELKTESLVAQNICSTTDTNIRFINYGYTVFVRRRDGVTVHLQRDSKNYRHSVHVWINSQYAGVHPIPISLSYPDLTVILVQRLMTEIWMGQVRLVPKIVPVVRYCPSIWNKSDI